MSEPATTRDQTVSPEQMSPEHVSPAHLPEELVALRASVDQLVATLGREHERASFRESVIDRLHAENQQLRRGELEALLAPVRSGLFRLHDLARRAADDYRAAAQVRPEQAAQLLAGLADEAVDALGRVGVERFDPEPGEAYDAARHRPVTTVPAAQPHHHHTVAQVRVAGFATADRVLRRADVVVATYQTPPPEPPQPESSEGEQ